MAQPDPAVRGRPFGVVLLTLLLLAYAVLSTPHVLDLPGVTEAGLAHVVREPDVRAAAQVAQSAVAALAALGLWLRRRWGWVGADEAMGRGYHRLARPPPHPMGARAPSALWFAARSPALQYSRDSGAGVVLGTRTPKVNSSASVEPRRTACATQLPAGA